jgi:thymidylate synthase (FAD)
MRLIKPSVEIIEQGSGLEGIYKQIEQAGRNCYQSSHLIKEGSAKPFVDRMIESGHHAMLEHGTVYLLFANTGDDSMYYQQYAENPYSKARYDSLGYVYVTTNLRVLVENEWMDDLKYVCDPTPIHERRVTARFTTQIAITREFNRHRVNSIAEESTRYCNYSKDKYGNEITINVPTWVDAPSELPTFEDLVRGIEFGDYHKD